MYLLPIFAVYRYKCPPVDALTRIWTERRRGGDDEQEDFSLAEQAESLETGARNHRGGLGADLGLAIVDVRKGLCKEMACSLAPHMPSPAGRVSDLHALR